MEHSMTVIPQVMAVIPPRMRVIPHSMLSRTKLTPLLNIQAISFKHT